MTARGRVVRRVAGAGLVALVCVAAVGCGGEQEEERGMRIDWDLSGEHTLDQVAWQRENLDLTSTQIKPIESVRIRLPGGQELRERDRVKDIILYRRSQGPDPLPAPEGRVLEQVEVYSEPLSVQDAYRRALAYADQFGLSRRTIDAWRERRRQGIEQATDRTPTGKDEPLGGEDGPRVVVELLYSYNDERPWAVMVQLYWPPPREG